MERLGTHLVAGAIALATLMVTLGGAIHTLAPADRVASDHAALCIDASSARCDARDADSPTSPGAPTPHRHQRLHDHRCVLCQLLRAHAALTEAPITTTAALSPDVATRCPDPGAPAAPAQRRQLCRAPPLG